MSVVADFSCGVLLLEMRSPNGYDTMLSGDGEELSQGQRQLLSIAKVPWLIHLVTLLRHSVRSSAEEIWWSVPLYLLSSY